MTIADVIYLNSCLQTVSTWSEFCVFHNRNRRYSVGCVGTNIYTRRYLALTWYNMMCLLGNRDNSFTQGQSDFIWRNRDIKLYLQSQEGLSSFSLSR